MIGIGLYLTHACNQDCVFCFKEKGPLYISSEDLDAFCAWSKKNNVNAAKIAGGEPTFHPDFVKHIDTIKRHIRPMHLQIITNLVCDEDKLKAFNNCNVLVNASVDHSPRDLEIFQRNLGRVIAAPGTRVSLSHTIWGLEQPDEHLLHYCKEFEIKHVRIDFSRASIQRDNKHITLEQIGDFKPKLLSIGRRLTEMGVEVNFDCQMPMGIFTAEDLKPLDIRNPRIVDPKYCTCIMVYVNPDLTISSCPWKVILPRRLDDFESYECLFESVNDAVMKKLEETKDRKGSYFCMAERFL
jgi:hypothetical protein